MCSGRHGAASGEGEEDDKGSWAGPRPDGPGGFSWARWPGVPLFLFSFLFIFL